MQRPARALLAALVLAPLAACSPPLAVRDAWFDPLSRPAERAEDDARAAVRHWRAVHAARRDCLPGAAPALAAAPPAAPAGAAPCPPPGAAPGAFGAATNAYRRWATDAVRELPVLSDTAAGAAGE